jgi:hypothetical protein
MEENASEADSQATVHLMSLHKGVVFLGYLYLESLAGNAPHMRHFSRALLECLGESLAFPLWLCGPQRHGAEMTPQKEYFSASLTVVSILFSIASCS